MEPLRGRGRNWGTEISNRRLSQRSSFISNFVSMWHGGIFLLNETKRAKASAGPMPLAEKLTHNHRNTTSFLLLPSERKGHLLAGPSSGSPRRGCRRKILWSWGSFRQISALTGPLNKCLHKLKPALVQTLNPDQDFAPGMGQPTKHKLRSQWRCDYCFPFLLIGYAIFSKLLKFFNLSFICKREIIIFLKELWWRFKDTL